VKKITALMLVIGLVNAPAVFAQEAAQISSALSSAPSNTQKVKANDNFVTLNFTNIDIGALVKVMSELTRRNFLLDEHVTGKVTLMTPNRISPDEATKYSFQPLRSRASPQSKTARSLESFPPRRLARVGLKYSRTVPPQEKAT